MTRKTYRNSTQVLLDILDSLTEQKLMSEIGRQSRVAFDVCAIIVNELKKRGFVNTFDESTYTKYQLSSNGLEFLKHLRIWLE